MRIIVFSNPGLSPRAPEVQSARFILGLTISQPRAVAGTLLLLTGDIFDGAFRHDRAWLLDTLIANGGLMAALRAWLSGGGKLAICPSADQADFLAGGHARDWLAEALPGVGFTAPPIGKLSRLPDCQSERLASPRGPRKVSAPGHREARSLVEKKAPSGKRRSS
jgi:hypothetical protein